METPVKFMNRRGHYLFGMLFKPDNGHPPEVGILMCVSSIKHRIGPCRLYTLLARALCLQGYQVMCFDPAGVGDSEGSLDKKSLAEQHLDIQKGKFREDIQDAIGFCLDHGATERLILFGLCGGAVSAIIAGASDLRVNGLILLAVPVLLERVATQEASSRQGGLGMKLRPTREAPAILRKATTFLSLIKVRCRLNAREVLGRFTRFGGRCRLAVPAGRAGESGEALTVSSHPRFNHLFLHAFYGFASAGKRILFVLPENDLSSWIFKSEFQQSVLTEGSPYRSAVDVHMVLGANHNFAGRSSQQKVLDVITPWLARHTPAK